MMLHLRYKHFNEQHSTTIFEPTIKIEPGVFTEPNKIKLPGVPCKKCSKFISNKSMKSNENGLCRRCTNSNEPKVEESHDTEMEMNQEQDIDDIPDLDEDMEKDMNDQPDETIIKTEHLQDEESNMNFVVNELESSVTADSEAAIK